ncbi:putative ribosome biogenesis GTPase RsgA [Sesbania bispinosa]|nr:putative ribosome biogenesis GTPase RsgA [Sesbania bispinosa]
MEERGSGRTWHCSGGDMKRRGDHTIVRCGGTMEKEGITPHHDERVTRERLRDR